MENIEYIGSFINRKVDQKRRVCLPEKLLQGTDLFVPVWQGEELRLYTYGRWKDVYEKLDEEEQKKWLKSTNPMKKIGTIERFLLPIECSWKIVDIVGMIEYISIKSSSK